MMEKVIVNIEDIADALEMTMDGWEQYLNMETGEIVSLSDGMWSDRDDEDEALAEEVDTTDKYVRLPNQYDIHEYEIMEEFAYATPNPRHQEKLLRALRGRKPYRSFKDEINYLGISESYYAWRTISLCKQAKNWCEDNEIPYKITTEEEKVVVAYGDFTEGGKRLIEFAHLKNAGQI